MSGKLSSSQSRRELASNWLDLSAICVGGDRSNPPKFWLCSECRKCKRQSEITAGTLAERFGRDALVSAVMKRLVCENCGTRDPVVLIGMKRRAGIGPCAQPLWSQPLKETGP